MAMLHGAGGGATGGAAGEFAHRTSSGDRGAQGATLQVLLSALQAADSSGRLVRDVVRGGEKLFNIVIDTCQQRKAGDPREKSPGGRPALPYN
jgi:hypothetical protein